MTKKVKLVIEAEYEAYDDRQANASILRIRSQLVATIGDSKVPGVSSGVVPGSVRVEIKEKSVT